MEEKGHFLESSKNRAHNKAYSVNSVSDKFYFKKDINFLYLLKKTERLISAMYLLTNLFPEKEPLKWMMRRSSLKVIPHIVSTKKINSEEEREIWIQEQEVIFSRIKSLLETAYWAGLISNMNFSILFEEVDKLTVESLGYAQNLKIKIKGPVISETNFQVDKGHLYKGQNDIKDNIENKIKGQNLNINRQGQATSIARPLDYKKVNSFEDNSERKLKKNDRQVKIIEIVKNTKQASIKDISEFIKDCSEKTIQRELISMVNSGVLKMEGKKRWSKYSLNI